MAENEKFWLEESSPNFYIESDWAWAYLDIGNQTRTDLVRVRLVHDTKPTFFVRIENDFHFYRLI